MIYHKLPRTRDTKWLLRFAAYASIFLVLVGVIYRIKEHRVVNPNPAIPQDGDVLLHVGKETIYYRDLNTELSSYPNPTDESAKGILTQKLIADSVILQGGKDDGIIELDSTFYNSSEKDYVKRMQMVSEVKKVLGDEEDNITGRVVAIWFYNNDYVGPLGYQKGKELALKKITELHTLVLSGKLTINKAGEIIRNDKSLAQLDPVYMNNAFFDFDVKKTTPAISLSTDLDNELWSLEIGGVSQIYTAKTFDEKLQKEMESAYIFGQVLGKKSSSHSIGFTTWLSQKTKIYEVSSQ